MRVLFVYREDVDVDGGAAAVMKETSRALQMLGVEVETTYELYPKVDGFDAVHVFNIWSPQSAWEQLKHLRRTGIPIIWSPFYLHWCECAWASLAFELIYHHRHSPEELEKIKSLFAAGTLEINGLSRWKPNEVIPGFHFALKEMLACTTHVCAASYQEMQKFAQLTGSNEIPFSVTPHGVNAASYINASPEPFINAFGIRDFVLCVGAVDRRKNQLLLIEALKGTSLPIVLLGPAFEQDYLDACKILGGSQILFTGRLSLDMVASAYKAASVHVLPSYAEGAALANLEAAVAGCAMVVSNRSSEFEYFGAAPFYCNPHDPESIRTATFKAMQSGAVEKTRWRDLGRHVAETFTWRKTAELTRAVYEKVLSGTNN
ncbi:MAG: glycosyltransferase [Syntrophobacter sp.]